MKITSLTCLVSLTISTAFSMHIDSQKQYERECAKFEVFVENLKNTWKQLLSKEDILPCEGYTDDALIELIYLQYTIDLTNMSENTIDCSQDHEFTRSILRKLIPEYDENVVYWKYTPIKNLNNSKTPNSL